MKKPYFSVIVPCYNCEKTIEQLMASINSSKYKNYEVIVADDGSTDKTQSILSRFKALGFRLKIVKQKHRGPGAARNLGAKKAKSEILVFTESDAVFQPDTLSQIVKSFENKKRKAVMGFVDKEPANPYPSWFPQFKALRDYAYWNIDRAKNLPIGGFGGAIGAIDKKFFQKLGGFDENLPEMEDQEMGWRINQLSKIYYNPKIKVKHHYGGFLKTLVKFYQRSFFWFGLFEKYKKFFGPAMNPYEAMVAGLANLSTGFFFLALFFSPLWFLFLITFLLRLFFGRKFLGFILKEKGIVFLIPTIFYSHALYLAVYAGVARALLQKVVRR